MKFSCMNWTIDHRRYTLNLSSCEIPKKIRTHDLCDTGAVFNADEQ